MTSLCDICGKPRGRKGHEACSKKRQALGFPGKKKISEAERLTNGRVNARRYLTGKAFIPA